MIRAGKRYRRSVSIEFMGHFSTYKHIQTSCHMGVLRWFSYIFMSPMNTLTMHYTVFLLVLLFLGFSLRPPCGSEQRTDRPMVIKRNRNSSLLLSDSEVTCPSSDSSLLGLAHCFAETCPTPSRDVQDEGLTELELSVFPQLIGQKPLPSALPGRLWPQMACLWEQWENLCPQALGHCLRNEVASVVLPLCLSDEETETHMITEVFQVLLPPQEDIRENLHSQSHLIPMIYL